MYETRALNMLEVSEVEQLAAALTATGRIAAAT